MGMTEKELKKLSRRQLLELLLEQTERADQLQAKLDEAERRLRDRTLTESEAGSIAEAALRLNGVFESAEAAAAQYIENVKKLSENQALFNERGGGKPEKGGGSSVGDGGALPGAGGGVRKATGGDHGKAPADV